MIMSVNNLELIKPLLKFEDEWDFYFLQIIQRKKDNTDPNFKLEMHIDVEEGNSACAKNGQMATIL